MSKKITTPAKEQLKALKRGAVDIIPEEELLEKLEKSFDTDTPLVVKFGADPSSPDIHLGHSIVLRKLKLLQDFGHRIVFIIGDFTAKIGDPTGKSKTRPVLTDEEVKRNAETYKEQVGKILDMDKVEVVFNSEWLDKISSIDLVKLMATTTVSSMMDRDDFSKRFKNETPIFLHEFVYPLMQGFDSVHLNADLELGGTDQTFNLLMGRSLQKHFKKAQQSILTMPILEGTDGVNKMSKSLGNFIAINDTAEDIFGKIMSISDELMPRYIEMLSCKEESEVIQWLADLKSGKLHPMESKKQLATEITDLYHKGKGHVEREKFDKRFSKGLVPEDIDITEVKEGECNLPELFMAIGFADSKGAARRLIKQKALRIDGVVSLEENLQVKEKDEKIIKLGKRRIVKLVGVK